MPRSHAVMYAAGKKKQKRKPSTDIDGLLASMGEAPANGDKEPDAAEAEADEPAASKQKEKKKKRDRKPAGDVDALLAQLEGSAAPQEPELQQPEEAEQLEKAPADLEQDAPAASKSDKGKRRNKDKPAKGADEDLDALLAEIGGDSSVSKPEQPAEASPAAQKEPEQPAPSSEPAAEELPAAEESPAAKAGGKKKKKKGKHVCSTLIKT